MTTKELCFVFPDSNAQLIYRVEGEFTEADYDFVSEVFQLMKQYKIFGPEKEFDVMGHESRMAEMREAEVEP